MDDIPLPSRIEQLPNEIFLQIFSYLCHKDLCRAWTDLNFRLDSVLRTVRSCFHLFSDNEIKYGEKYLQEWAKIIVCFKDHRRSWSAWSEFNIEELKPINIRPFVNLRRFSQLESENSSLNQITPENFPYFECLHFGYSKAHDYSRILFDDQFPFLTTVSGVYLDRKLWEGTTINNTLRQVEVTLNYEANLFPLLISFIKRLPNLTTLHVSTNKLEETVLPSKIATKIRILSLNVDFDIDLDEIEFLLQISPVKRFNLQIGIGERWDNGAKPFDFVRLAHILRNCQILRHVQLRVWLHDEQLNIEEIRALSPWFTTLNLEYMHYHRRNFLETYRDKFEKKYFVTF